MPGPRTHVQALHVSGMSLEAAVPSSTEVCFKNLQLSEKVFFWGEGHERQVSLAARLKKPTCM